MLKTVIIMSTQSIPSALPLQGKVAIVTGASRGIGAGLALELARRGAKVSPPILTKSIKPLTHVIGHPRIHISEQRKSSRRDCLEDQITWQRSTLR